MDIRALINHTNVHASPTVERFYRLQVQRIRQPQFSSTVPAKRRAEEVSRDRKIEARTLRNYARWSYQAISQTLGVTIRQVERACDGPVTPQKTGHVGRLPLIRTPQKEILRHYLEADDLFRELPWGDLKYYIPGFELFGETAIFKALRSMGYSRRKRPRRIELTAQHRAARLAFAYEQLALRPNPEDWEKVIFSDETWATNNPMWKRWITVHDTEDPRTWALLRQKPHGWMFWGCFAGRHKGPGFFWEKGYGGIDAAKYQHFVLPLVWQFWGSLGNEFVFQQDNASAHRARSTRRLIAALGFEVMEWPARSPDLNPIENLWHWLKNYIEDHYDLQRLSLATLRTAIEEAWDAIPEDFLLRLAHSMLDRLRKVIAANGGSIEY